MTNKEETNMTIHEFIQSMGAIGAIAIILILSDGLKRHLRCGLR